MKMELYNYATMKELLKGISELDEQEGPFGLIVHSMEDESQGEEPTEEPGEMEGGEGEMGPGRGTMAPDTGTEYYPPEEMD